MGLQSTWTTVRTCQATHESRIEQIRVDLSNYIRKRVRYDHRLLTQAKSQFKSQKMDIWKREMGVFSGLEAPREEKINIQRFTVKILTLFILSMIPVILIRCRLRVLSMYLSY